MTYNVFGGTLNLAQQLPPWRRICDFQLCLQCVSIRMYLSVHAVKEKPKSVENSPWQALSMH